MRVDFEGKSAQYTEELHRCLLEYRKSGDRRLLEIFLKYADHKTGVVWGREGLLKLLSPGAKNFLFVLALDIPAPYLIVNGTLSNDDQNMVKTYFGRVVIREIAAEKVFNNLNKFEYLLWIKDERSIKELRFVSLNEELIYLRSLGSDKGFFFDQLVLV